MRLFGILIVALAMTGCATRGSVKELTARVSAVEAAATVSESRDLEQDEAIAQAQADAKNAASNAGYAAQAALAAQKKAEDAAETAKRVFEKQMTKGGCSGCRK